MKLTVKHIYEGTMQEVRFWLETEVNGRIVQSRGTTLKISGTTQEIRQESRRIANYAQMRIDNMVEEGLQPKQADAALAEIIHKEIPADDATWNEITKLFN